MRRSLFAGVVLLVCPTFLSAQVTITVDGSTTHQTMSGWECTTFIAEPCTPPAELAALRDAVLAAAVNDVGINRLRLEVRSGVENSSAYYQNWVDDGCPEPPTPEYQTWRENRYATVNDNADPGVIDWTGFHFTELDWTIEEVVLPMRALLQARGEELFVNLCYVAFTGQIQGGSYDHGVAAEYAELVLATHLHMQQAYGFIPDSWEVILEPDLVAQWNGTGIGEAIAASAVKLQQNGITQRFVAPSNSTMSEILAYFDDMIAVPGVLDHLEMFSYHRYGANDATLAQMAQRATTNGLDMGMLEWWFGNATYEVLHKDLTLGRNSSWQGSVLAGLFDIDLSDPLNPILEYDRDTMYNRQYFKHVRRGADRVEATSDDGSFAPVAFFNADGKPTVVVKTTGAGSLSIGGLPAGTYGIHYTTGGPTQLPTAYDVDLPDVTISAGEAIDTAIPDLGLITVYGRTPTVAVGDAAAVVGARLSAHPNPFTVGTTLSYSLVRAGVVDLRIYDVAGRFVETLMTGEREPGRYDAAWTGGTASPGVYFYRLSVDGRALAVRKLVRTP